MMGEYDAGYENCIDTMVRQMGDMQFRIDILHRENAKLRDLVRIAVKHCDSGTCDGCPIQGENGSCPFSDMARELGVEVEG